MWVYLRTVKARSVVELGDGTEDGYSDDLDDSRAKQSA